MTYGYCKNPTGIESPYTLPQAIALRIVSESYNRMSMDNLAVVVLDVRELAATVDEAVPAHEQPCLSGICPCLLGLSLSIRYAVTTWVSDMFGTLCRLVSAAAHKAAPDSKQHAADFVADLARPSSVAEFQSLATAASIGDREQPGGSDCVDCYGKVPLVWPGVDAEASQLLDVHLPLCDTHHVLETSDGLFVVGKDMLPVMSDPKDSHSKPLASLSEDLSPTAKDSKLSQGERAHNSASSPVVKGSAIVCRTAPIVPLPAQATASRLEAANQYQHPQETAVKPHSYLLVQRFASAVSIAADHMHVHPLLGLEELQLEASVPAHQQPGIEDHGVEHDGRQLLVSFAR